jgi:PBSX family phage terminase large subunit
VALLHCRAPEVLVSGPAGTGKSRACLEKLHLICLLNDNAKCLLVRKTAVSLTSSALATYEQIVAQEALASGAVRFFGGSKRVPPQYQYVKTGAVINIGGMDNPTRVMSTEYDIAFAQEAIELTVDDWEAISSRLRNGVVSFQQLLADTNPAQPTHWLKQRCDRGDTILLESRHEDNPRLFSDSGAVTQAGAEYMARLDNLTGVRFHRLRKGLWVAAEGVIFEDFDPAVHVLPRFPIPPEWTRWWVVDFGFTNPFVLQCWAEDGDGRLFMYREIYHTRRTVDQHAATILDQVAPLDDAQRRRVDAGLPVPLRERRWVEPKPRGVICDWDAEGRETFSQAAGLGTVPADKRVIYGLEAGQRRFRKRDDGTVGAYFLEGSLVEVDQDLVEAKLPTRTVEEIPAYVWDQSPGKPPKEQPRKENDHGCDDYRYLCAHREMGSPRIRSLG